MLVLVACGGGCGGGSAAISTPVPPTATPTPMPAVTPLGREILGSWLYAPIPSFRDWITIYREDDKLYISHKYHDGSVGQTEAKETATELGLRFDQINPRSDSGDHFIIDKRGNLQVRDREGLISTARKTDIEGLR